MLGISILVVDDDKRIFELIKEILQREELIESGKAEYIIHYASNLTEARHKIEDIYFNLAIVDLRLEKEKGVDMRNFFDPQSTIFMTGYDDEIKNLQKVLTYNKEDILRKPFTSLDLNIAIQRIANKKKHPDVASALFTIAQSFTYNDEWRLKVEKRFDRLEHILTNGLCDKVSDSIINKIKPVIQAEMQSFACPYHKERMNAQPEK